MKKLYSAEVSGIFVFVVDTDNVKKGREAEEAHKYLNQESMIPFFIDSVNSIDDINEIPSDWEYKKPLGAGPEDDECKSYFEGREEAERVTAGLLELGYDLDNNFAEDIRGLLIKEL